MSDSFLDAINTLEDSDVLPEDISAGKQAGLAPTVKEEKFTESKKLLPDVIKDEPQKEVKIDSPRDLEKKLETEKEVTPDAGIELTKPKKPKDLEISYKDYKNLEVTKKTRSYLDDVATWAVGKELYSGEEFIKRVYGDSVYSLAANYLKEAGNEGLFKYAAGDYKFAQQDFPDDSALEKALVMLGQVGIELPLYGIGGLLFGTLGTTIGAAFGPVGAAVGGTASSLYGAGFLPEGLRESFLVALEEEVYDINEFGNILANEGLEAANKAGLELMATLGIPKVIQKAVSKKAKDALTKIDRKDAKILDKTALTLQKYPNTVNFILHYLISTAIMVREAGGSLTRKDHEANALVWAFFDYIIPGSKYVNKGMKYTYEKGIKAKDAIYEVLSNPQKAVEYLKRDKRNKTPLEEVNEKIKAKLKEIERQEQAAKDVETTTELPRKDNGNKGWKQNTRETIEKADTALNDSLAPIQNLWNRNSDTRSWKQKITSAFTTPFRKLKLLNPVEVLRLLPMAKKQALESVEFGIEDFNTTKIISKGIKPIVENLPLPRKAASEYLINRNNIKEFETNPQAYLKKDMSKKTIEQMRKENASMEKQYGKRNLNRMVKDIQQLQLALNKRDYDSGRFSKEQYNEYNRRITEEGYIPQVRLTGKIDAKTGDVIFETQTGRRQFERTREGSNKKIQDPFVTLYEDIILRHQQVEWNASTKNFFNELKKLQKQYPENAELLEFKFSEKTRSKEQIDKASTDLITKEGDLKAFIEVNVKETKVEQLRGDATISYRDGNKLITVTMPKVYEKAIRNFEPIEHNFVIKLMKPVADLVRYGATANPGFLGMTFLRDAFGQPVFGKYFAAETAIPVVNVMMGLASQIIGGSKKFKDVDSMYNKHKRSGARMSNLSQIIDFFKFQEQSQLIKGDTRKPHGYVELGINTSNILKYGRSALEMFENASRLQEFKASYRTTKKNFPNASERQIRQRAAFDSMDLINFSKIGTSMKAYSAISAFANPAIRGIDVLLNRAKTNPTRFAMLGILYVTVPTLLLYRENYNDPDYDTDIRGSEASKRFYHKKLVFSDKPGDYTWIKVPRPYGLSTFFGLFAEAILEDFNQYDQEALDNFFLDLPTNLFKDIYSFSLPNAVESHVENEIIGKKIFTGQDIIPGKFQKYYEYPYLPDRLSSLSIILQNMTGFNPFKIDNVIKSYTAGLGNMALKEIDKTLDELGILKRSPEVLGKDVAQNLDKIPLVRYFVYRKGPQYNSGIVQRYYNALEKYEKFYNTYQKLKNTRPFASQKKVDDYYLKHEKEINIYKKLNNQDVQETIRLAYKNIDKTNILLNEQKENPNVLKKAKDGTYRDFFDSQYKLIIEAAHKAMYDAGLSKTMPPSKKELIENVQNDRVYGEFLKGLPLKRNPGVFNDKEIEEKSKNIPKLDINIEGFEQVR